MDATPRQLRTIVSGGQTGVDRAALDVAIELGFEHGGWCPLGRLAEDGYIPAKYALTQTASAEYAVRTEKNVVDSDATLIVYRKEITGGTLLTRRLAQKHVKPLLCVDLTRSPKPEEARAWIVAQNTEVLNNAGPRESTSPGIAAQAADYLRAVLGEIKSV